MFVFLSSTDRSLLFSDCTIFNKQHSKCFWISVCLRLMSIDKHPVILSSFSRRRLCLPLTNENMNDLIELFDHFQQRLIEKQKLVEIQREDVHHSINRTFNKIFEQLIEIRRFCRNDNEQQTLNAQVC